MHRTYEDWPDVAADAYAQDVPSVDLEGINHIAFSGMGGSGIVGDIIAALLSQTAIKTTIIKGYNLPKTVDDSTLVVCCSASGDTAETMSVLRAATQTRLLGVSSGGQLGRFCTANNIPFVRTRLVHSPRASLPCMLYPILKALDGLLPISKGQIASSIDEIARTKKTISADNAADNAAMNIANSIDAIPIIYYPHGLLCVATRFKNSLHENAKVHAMIEDVIEACHNNVVAWERTAGVMPVIIRGFGDHEKTMQRWDILKEFFVSKDIRYLEVTGSGQTILARILSLIYMLDYATIFLAARYGQDPSVIAPIDFIKSRLV